MHHPTADRPIEHPSGRFQTTCAFLTRLRAAQNAHTAPLHRFMYEHRPAKPRMPGIKNFPFLGPVGVMLSSCTIRRARTWHCGRMRRYGELSKDQEPSLPHQFCSDCIITTGGYDFREGQGLRQGFHELGYVEGRNLRLEYRWILGVHHRYVAMIFAGIVGSDEGRRLGNANAFIRAKA